MQRMGLLDKGGIPFTADRFMHEPGLMHEFMEVYETLYFGHDLKWRELTEDELFRDASFRLYCMEQDLEHADFLKRKDLIH